MACRVQEAGARVGNVGGDNHQLEAVHKLDGSVSAALDRKGEHAAGAVGQVLLRHLIVVVALEVGVVNPRHLVLRLEEPRDFESVFAVAVHSDVQAFESVVQIERVLRRLN